MELKKPHKLPELCGLSSFQTKKLFATYGVILDHSSSPVKQKKKMVNRHG
jgi:hypothetical protein